MCVCEDSGSRGFDVLRSVQVFAGHPKQDSLTVDKTGVHIRLSESWLKCKMFLC